MISITQKKPSCAITRSMLFFVSKDEWNTKEDTGKSMKNALYILWHAKEAPLGLKQCQTVKKWSQYIPLPLLSYASKGIKQAGRQLVSYCS